MLSAMSTLHLSSLAGSTRGRLDKAISSTIGGVTARGVLMTLTKGQVKVRTTLAVPDAA